MITNSVIRAKTPEHALAMVAQLRKQQVGNDPNKVRLRAHLSNYASYGMIAEEVGLGLLKRGINVELSPIGRDHENNRHGSKLDAELEKRILPHLVDDEQFTLLIHPPDYQHYVPYESAWSNMAWLTMWEATKMHSEWVQSLNKAKAVIVPCNYCLDTFSANGVQVPMFKVPLGVHTKPKTLIFKSDQPFTFGCGGRLAHGGVRKGVDGVIAAFKKAFPDNPDVRLSVKLFSDCKFEKSDDNRITYIREYLQPDAMDEWYASLNCFVSMAQSEGFGLMPLAAMRTGRPVISPIYSGTAEYMHETVCYPVDFSYQKASGHYTHAGHWIVPSVEHCADQMRHVYENYDSAMIKAALGSAATEKYTWDSMVENLLKVLRIIN